MDCDFKREEADFTVYQHNTDHTPDLGAKTSTKTKPKSADKDSPTPASAKRRCVSTACIACRKRKSKCDGNTPSCAACSSVYGTDCIYDPNSDHRRKGVYKKDVDGLKTQNSTLQTLIEAILNFPEHEAYELVRQIRTCESLDDVAETIVLREQGLATSDEDEKTPSMDSEAMVSQPQFEKELSGKMGRLRLDNGSVSIIGGTSNLIFIANNGDKDVNDDVGCPEDRPYILQEEPTGSWTQVTNDSNLVMHLMNMYFTWHYTYFTTLSRTLFWRDFKQGKPKHRSPGKTEYCTELLVNAMLALGCHFTAWPDARAKSDDSATAGDHFFTEAKRLIRENDEQEKPSLATVQALALMSVREAGCGREARGWVYSGMSFRMAYDLGLNINSGSKDLDETEIDARRVTIWGCFLFDKCWSNYLGRQPQLPRSSISTPRFDVFPMEDAEIWRPYLDKGTSQIHSQASRTRTVALQISQLCEISGDLLMYFYHPNLLEKPVGKQAELKKLSDLHTRLEAWKKNLPKELESREGQLPNVLVMHMFYQLLFIHLFRPFLKYNQANSPLPSHISPRKFITHSAAAISKLLRLYRRTYGLRQICNIVVYIAHTACTVHLLNLPDKSASRDIAHGLNHLEEIAESWLCARRTLGILYLVTRRWNIDLPESAVKTFMRTEAKFGSIKPFEIEVDGEAHARDLLRPEVAPPIHHATPDPSHPPRYQADQPSTNSSPPSTTMPFFSLPPELSTSSSLQAEGLQFDINPNPVSMQSEPDFTKSHLTQGYAEHPVAEHDWNHVLFPDGAAVGLSRVQNTPLERIPSQPVTSPTMLFSGVQGLVQDQEWWLRDSNSFCGAWNSNIDGLTNSTGLNISQTALGYADTSTMTGITKEMRDAAQLANDAYSGTNLDGKPYKSSSDMLHAGDNGLYPSMNMSNHTF